MLGEAGLRAQSLPACDAANYNLPSQTVHLLKSNNSRIHKATAAEPDRAEMGLLTILTKMKQKERELRLLMLGLDNAGKTTILKKFNGEDVSTISPTLGFNIKTLEHKGFKLNIWDVGGQKSLRSYWRNYFESTDGLVWVVDSADRLRLQDCKDELSALLREERLAGATLLVFANKQDLPGSLSKDAIREALALDELKSHHWCIIGCSAITGENLLAGMDWLLDDIGARIFTAD
ncbi:ADP-ribosylation factor-like protein 2 [Solea solea]|uniref:ADP-ribosylation factor-like protein 2 n=1 Tax=Solea solea TaxID=90069 RepID=UPI00272BE5C3|nr:ADP-ribosylation factor-like protein 2 [Solea solea]